MYFYEVFERSLFQADLVPEEDVVNDQCRESQVDHALERKVFVQVHDLQIHGEIQLQAFHNYKERSMS